MPPGETPRAEALAPPAGEPAEPEDHPVEAAVDPALGPAGERLAGLRLLEGVGERGMARAETLLAGGGVADRCALEAMLLVAAEAGASYGSRWAAWLAELVDRRGQAEHFPALLDLNDTMQGELRAGAARLRIAPDPLIGFEEADRRREALRQARELQRRCPPEAERRLGQVLAAE
jgi:hypothetical protein